MFSERYLVKRPLLQALAPDTGRRAGPADRRTRPHGRGVRGLPAGGAVRLPGDDPRARHDQGRASADRDHHLEPHARDPRRAEAPLPLSLGRLSRRRARAGDPASKAPGRRRALSQRDRRLRAGDPQAGPVQGAGRRRDARLGDGPGRARRRRARPRDWSPTRSACCSSTRTTSRRCRAEGEAHAATNEMQAATISRCNGRC